MLFVHDVVLVPVVISAAVSYDPTFTIAACAVSSLLTYGATTFFQGQKPDTIKVKAD